MMKPMIKTKRNLNAARILGLLLAVFSFTACKAQTQPEKKETTMMDASRYFQGEQLKLAQAIDTDNAGAVGQEINRGAKVDEPGKTGITPLMYALVQKKKNAAKELLLRGANPNRRAENGHNAVTLAERLAYMDLDYLRIVLEFKGDPNTREPNNDPIMSQMISEHNIDGIRLLAAKGADLNARDRTNDPMTLVAGSIEHWDAVWALIELGSDWRASEGGRTLAYTAYTAAIRPGWKDYPWYEKTVEYLKEQGVKFPPPSPNELMEKEEQEAKKKGGH
jgi:uncharacterized protein